jgi:hypothetical protein
MSLLIETAPTEAADSAPLVPPPAPRTSRFLVVTLALVLLAGCFLRVPDYVFAPENSVLHWLAPLHPTPKFKIFGFDERLYRGYVSVLILNGMGAYPEMARHYVQQMQGTAAAILPPTRFSYIGAAYIWHSIWGTGPLKSLCAISSLCSLLLLGLSACFAWRLGGGRMALCVTALMAFAPTQIHMSQHALIDGVFAFWATLSLWLLWENLQRPNRWPWLLAYCLALAVMVLTKENAMFAHIGILVLLAANYWLRFGRLTVSLCIASVVGPMLGVVILMTLCGGFGTMIDVYRLLVNKASVLDFAIQTGDGPWYRYLVDLMIVSPVILILAIGGVFRLKLTERGGLYLFSFVAASFVVMANVRYGMNLRYTNMWDLPLRYLAALCLWEIVPRRNLQAIWISLCVALLCTIELRQYDVFFVQNDLYELIPYEMLHAVKILK